MIREMRKSLSLGYSVSYCHHLGISVINILDPFPVRYIRFLETSICQLIMIVMIGSDKGKLMVRMVKEGYGRYRQQDDGLIGFLRERHISLVVMYDGRTRDI